MKKILRWVVIVVLTLVLCVAIWQLTLFIGLGNAASQPGPGKMVESLFD